MMVLTLAGRELRTLFLSPLAWAILAVVELLVGYLFLAQVDMFMQIQPRLSALDGVPGVTELVVAPTFANAGIVLLLVVPLLTMRLVSDERRGQTLPLLFSAPVSMTEIILGKYFGVLGFLLITLGLILLMPISLLLGGALDYGMLLGGLLGLTLLVGTFSAIGLYMSTLTSQPGVAAVSTFGLLLLLWMLDWAGAGAHEASEVFRYFSMLKHYEPLLAGAFKSSDVIYYLLIICVFLVLSVRRLDGYRLQH